MPTATPNMDPVAQDLDRLLPFFADLDKARKDVLVEIGRDVGIPGLLHLHRLLDAVQNKQWDVAGQELVYSEWATLAGQRGMQLAQVMLSGVVWHAHREEADA